MARGFRLTPLMSMFIWMFVVCAIVICVVVPLSADYVPGNVDDGIPNTPGDGAGS